MKEVQDHYFRKSKKEGFVARSVYKLQEIQEKHRLLAPGMTVADLGCAPGSWLQYTCRVVGPSGLVMGLDLQPVRITLPNRTLTLCCAIEDYPPDRPTDGAQALPERFDVTLSDMAPRSTGNAQTDNANSFDLGVLCLEFCADFLKPKGALVMKTFMGLYFEELLGLTRQNFQTVKTMKPKSSRNESKELFIIAVGKH